jgi:hypothetical protein
MRDQRRPWRRAPLRVVATAAVVALLATGCGGAGGGSSASGPGGSGQLASGTADPAGASSSGDDASSGFGWVPFGPTDPGDPPPNRWYGPLAEHSCSHLDQALSNEPGGHLWAALAALCAAAVDGDQSKWAVVATEAHAAASETPDGSADASTRCLNTAAQALLTRALAWHEDHPDAQPQVTMARAGQPTACPFRITSITLVDDNNNPLTGALEGPVTGGTRLAIHGYGLGNAPTVLVAGHPATIVGSEGSGGAVFVATPAVSHPLVGRIRVGNEAGQLLAKVTFQYVAAPTSTP